MSAPENERDRYARHGEHLFKSARNLGWKDDGGEGPFNFITRMAYAEGRGRATPAPSPAGCVSVPREPDHNMIKCAMAAAPAGLAEQQVEAIVRNALASDPSAVGEERLPTDVQLEPGWLARDVARASARVAELEGKSPSAPAPAPDGLVQRFVDALNFCDQPGQQPIQGFHYPPHFVIRNVRLSHGQELWRGPDDNRAAFERQCKIEKFKLIFASAGLLTGSAAEMRPLELTQEKIDEALKDLGWWVEPYTAPRESGVAIDGDISPEDAAEINEGQRKALIEIVEAVFPNVRLPLPQEKRDTEAPIDADKMFNDKTMETNIGRWPEE